MKKYIAVAGTLAVALAMSAAPAIAFAERDGIEASVNAAVRAQAQAQVGASTGVSARVDESMDGQQRRVEERAGQDDFDLELEDDEDVALSLDDLKQKIEDRKQELDDEEASTTPKFKNAMKNANEVRLAVHALLASKNLLGGIGQQISEIAKSMNDSVETTTNAEAQIESRNFFTKLFFGGDQKAAKVISKELERNQKSIEKLTELLDSATLSADFQMALNAQVTALEEAQARFQALAEKEQSRWGIFSWRF